MIECDRCGGKTREKVITSKRPETFGQKYILLECLNGCKDGKYNYSFFPPKEQKQVVSNPQPTTNIPARPIENGAVVNLLRSINSTLKNILSIMQSKTKEVPIQGEELSPDTEVPF